MYSIVFGGVAEGEDLEQAVQRLAALFSATPEKIRVLVDRPGTVIKKGLDQQQAERYRSAIVAAGGTCELRPEALEVDLTPLQQDPPPKQQVEPDASVGDVAEHERLFDLAAQWKKSKLETIFYGFVVVFGCAAGLAKLWGLAESKLSGPAPAVPSAAVQVGQLTPDESRFANDVRTNLNAAVAAGGQQFDVHPGISLTVKGNQYLEDLRCQFDFTATLTRDGRQLPPKWAMAYLYMAKDKFSLVDVSSFYGNREPLRMHFDGASDYLLMNRTEGTDEAVAPVHGAWADKLRSSRTLVVHQGQGAEGPTAFAYDLTHFGSVERLARAICTK